MPSIKQILLVFLKIACEITKVVYVILLCAREILERASSHNESLPEATENAPSSGGIERLQSRASPTPPQIRLQSPRIGTNVEGFNPSPSRRITDSQAEQKMTLSADSQKSGTGSRKGSIESISKLSTEEAGPALDPSISVDNLRLRASTFPVQESGMQCTPVETVDDPRKNQPKTPKKTPKTPQKTPKSKTPNRKFKRSHSQSNFPKKSPETDGKRNLFSRSREQSPGADVAGGYRPYDSSSTGEEQIEPIKPKSVQARPSRTDASEEKLLASDSLTQRHTETEVSTDLMYCTGESVLKARSLGSVNRHTTTDAGDGLLQDADASYKYLHGQTSGDPQGSRDSSQSAAAEHSGRFDANSRTETESPTSSPHPLPTGYLVGFPDVDISGVDDVVKTFRDFERSIQGDRRHVVETQSSSLPSASSTDSDTRRYEERMIRQVREYCEDIARDEESARNIALDPSGNTLLPEIISASGLDEASAGCFPSPGEGAFLHSETESPTDDADSCSPATHSSLPILYDTGAQSSLINSGDDIKTRKPHSAPTTDSERHKVDIIETCGPSSSNDLIIGAERVIEEIEMAHARNASVPTQFPNLQTEANREQESRDVPCKQVQEYETSAVRVEVPCPNAEIEENEGMECVKDVDKNVDEIIGTVDAQCDDSDGASLEDKATKKTDYKETDL